MRLTKKGALILLCSLGTAALATAATAKPHHHYSRAIAAMPVSPPSWRTRADRHIRYTERRATVPADLATAGPGRRSRFAKDPRVAQASANFIVAQSHSNSAYGGATSDPMVNEARKYIGTNPTGRGSQWCGAFMDMVLRRTGHLGGGNLAWGYSRYGRRIVSPQVGAIAVMHGHVGVVSGIDANGNPIIVSGNHNHTVAESVYPRGRIAAYVLPN
jgi:uncharacterized protein (TIGR02594 family)